MVSWAKQPVFLHGVQERVGSQTEEQEARLKKKRETRRETRIIRFSLPSVVSFHVSHALRVRLFRRRFTAWKTEFRRGKLTALQSTEHFNRTVVTSFINTSFWNFRLAIDWKKTTADFSANRLAWYQLHLLFRVRHQWFQDYAWLKETPYRPYHELSVKKRKQNHDWPKARQGMWLCSQQQWVGGSTRFRELTHTQKNKGFKGE